MNTYDPMERIVYRHMDQRWGSYPVPVMSTPKTNQLPSGYANRSPQTYLGRILRTTQTA